MDKFFLTLLVSMVITGERDLAMLFFLVVVPQLCLFQERSILYPLNGQINKAQRDLMERWRIFCTSKTLLLIFDNLQVRPFEHPFFEAVCMFVGEMLCMVAFQISILNAKRQVTQ